MNKNIAISLQNISKVYKLYDKPVDRLKESLHPLKKKYHKEFYALKNINLEVKKGEVLGIVGVNGAGKSTLLKIISGVLTPTTGRVNIHGRINAILELGSSLKPELTGRENIKLNLQINQIEKDREKLTQEIVEFADIGEHIDQPIKSYSSGMKARLGFGIATSTDPDILIVDEVLAVGDVLFKRKCYTKIENLFKDGKTVIFVSHSTQSVIEFCSRAVLLYDREIIMDDTPKKVTDYYQKLVFSKDKQKVLDEMNGKVEVKKEDQKQELEKVSVKEEKNKKIDSIKVDKKATLTEKFTYSKDYYLGGLQTEPKIINNANIKLDNICILNEKNEVVNKLITGCIYKIYFKVKFTRQYKDLSFSLAVLDRKGLILSGTKYFFCAEENIEFEYIFYNIFLEGDYYIKINFQEYGIEKLIEISDLMMFQVVESYNKTNSKKMFYVDIKDEINFVKGASNDKK